MDAPESFVQKRDNCDAGTANTLAIYHQSRKMAEVFKNRSAKLAYYYLREVGISCSLIPRLADLFVVGTCEILL